MTSLENIVTHLLTGYSLELEALLTWFPITNTGNMNAPKMRGISATYSSSADVFRVGNAEGLFFDGLAPDNAVGAIFEFYVNQDGFFDVIIEVHMVHGAPTRKKRILLKPDTRTPFMINLTAVGDNPIVKDTGLVLQGVFTTSRPASSMNFFGRASDT